MDFSIFPIHKKDEKLGLLNISLQYLTYVIETKSIPGKISGNSGMVYFAARSLQRNWDRNLQTTLIMWRGGLVFEFIWGMVGCTSFLFPIQQAVGKLEFFKCPWFHVFCQIMRIVSLGHYVCRREGAGQFMIKLPILNQNLSKSQLNLE